MVPPVGPAFACPPGSTPDKPGPVDQARPPCDVRRRWHSTAGRAGWWPSRIAGDEAARRGRSTCARTPGPRCIRTGSRRASSPTSLVYDVDSDVTIAVRPTRTRMWAYDLGADTWTENGPSRRLGVSTSDASGSTTRSPASSSPSADDCDDDTSAGAVELRRRDRHVDPDPPGEPLAIGPHYGSSPTTPPSTGWSCTPTWTGTREGRRFEARTWLFDLRTGTWSGPAP